MNIFFHFIKIELGKKVFAILDWETLIQLIYGSQLHDPLFYNKIQYVTTKGMVVRNKVKMVARHTDTVENFGCPKTNNSSRNIVTTRSEERRVERV